MIYKVIIDANVWIRFARSKDIEPLIKRFTLYNMLPVANNYLLSEIHKAVIDNKWMNEKKADALLNLIRKITFNTIENSLYAISPDPEDNYLFDLAVQNNCVFIISDDTELLSFPLKAVPVHSTNWFLKHFPI